MSEMIERVARALYGFIQDDFDRRQAARVVIEAMREPTEAMCVATYRDHAGRLCDTKERTIQLMRDHLWPTMIDEALK